jgi:hypothetical protein
VKRFDKMALDSERGAKRTYFGVLHVNYKHELRLCKSDNEASNGQEAVYEEEIRHPSLAHQLSVTQSQGGGSLVSNLIAR